MAGPQGAIGESDYSDGSGVLEEISDWVGLRQGDHLVPQTL